MPKPTAMLVVATINQSPDTLRHLYALAEVFPALEPHVDILDHHKAPTARLNVGHGVRNFVYNHPDIFAPTLDQLPPGLNTAQTTASIDTLSRFGDDLQIYLPLTAAKKSRLSFALQQVIQPVFLQFFGDDLLRIETQLIRAEQPAVYNRLYEKPAPEYTK